VWAIYEVGAHRAGWGVDAPHTGDLAAHPLGLEHVADTQFVEHSLVAVPLAVPVRPGSAAAS
jgi:hypothetical protein